MFVQLKVYLCESLFSQVDTAWLSRQVRNVVKTSPKHFLGRRRRRKRLKWFWKNKNVDASISIGATKRSSLKITFHLVYILFLDDSVTNLGYFQRSYSYESIPKLYQLFRLIWIKSLFKRNLLGNFCIFLSPFILHYGRTVAWWQDTNSKTGALGPRYFAKAMAKFLALLFIAKRRQMDKEDGWPI